jgi:hypothetical protein
VDFVPSGNDLFCLVISPGRGGLTVGAFLDWSAWHDAATFWNAGSTPAGWSASQRFFLHDLHLREKGVKDSIDLLERVSIGSQGARAWCWKISSASGAPASTQPMSTSSKEWVTLTFIEQGKSPEHFRFLLVRPKGVDLSEPPTIITLDDFPSDIV